MSEVRRNWSAEEIDAAANYVRTMRSDVWNRLQELEIESGDLAGEEVADIETGLLLGFYPDASLFDIARLQIQLRIKRSYT